MKKKATTLLLIGLIAGVGIYLWSNWRSIGITPHTGQGDTKSLKPSIVETPTLPARPAVKLQQRQEGVTGLGLVWVDTESITTTPLVPGDFITVSFLEPVAYEKYVNGKRHSTTDLRGKTEFTSRRDIAQNVISVGYKLTSEMPAGTKVLVAYVTYYPESAKPPDDVWFPLACAAGVPAEEKSGDS